ncbi:MAG: replication-associated recombination protein A [Sandaracinus sp.]|nr:replication-associated recombination protein A [Sandaracinus sp.]MCB9634513.1 replication-associated recombination protein A [Sandaracinus sp.]
MEDLFDRQAQSAAPLAERMRPERIADVVGQEAILGPGKLLARLVRADRLPSIVLYGPPGTGKTTLARVLANETSATFEAFSAVLGGVPELRKLLAAAKDRRRRGGRTILFVDEIHRFNKAQQDALLPHVEDGTVTLVGATTENPSFAVNAALLSRARVFRLESLSPEAVETLLRRALSDPRGVPEAKADDAAIAALAEAAGGDGRRALTILEALAADGRPIDVESVAQAFESRTLLYDKDGDQHYDVVSAFIKSMRGSDPDASLYWMFRMLEAGDDPRFVLRRMIIFASEDIGNADPRALQVAVAADQAFARLGMPEATHTLAQCCTYLAVAPKSNATYVAWKAAQAAVHAHGSLPVPMHLRNAPTKLMKAEGHGKGYRYPHDEGGFARGVTYLPEKLEGERYYEPTRNGLEGQIGARLARLRGEGGDGNGSETEE